MKKSILDIADWQGKRVLVREDLNVPLNEQGEITDDTRIQEALPTLKYLLEKGAKVVLMAHLGRPKGEANSKYSLAPVAKRLQTLLTPYSVTKMNEVFSSQVQQAVEQMKPGELVLLENVRFEPGEEKNEPELAKKLASLGDIYVNDAFGAAHRAHASTEGVAHYMDEKVAGLLMIKEIEALSLVAENPEKPYTAIIGGSKVSTKITVLENLIPKVNNLVIGGGMLFTFLKAKGLPVGNSLVENDYIEMAQKLLETAQQYDTVITLVKDVVVGDAFKADAQTQLVSVENIPDDWMGLDIGPESIQRIESVIKNSKTILWNGPLGVFEWPAFEKGTRVVAETIAAWTQESHCKSILGGGDTVAAIEQFKIDPKSFTHVSTGGGASLEFLEGKVLPGIAVLTEKEPVTA